jgi:EAL domain-containing protein (putative c-di-GMP-specific phosphodiesterase class I)
LQGLRAHREPIVRLSDEACVGYELLVRGPSGGAREGAEDVFRLAVGASDLAALDLDCLQVALGSLPGMPWDGPALPEIHVNLFPSTLASVPVERVLESFPRDRALRGFCLEIGEKGLVRDALTLKEPVRALRRAGLRVAIDDVGFGRSSLEALVELEPDVLKLDRRLLRGLTQEVEQIQILRRVVAVAEALAARVIAEGVEDRGALAVLRDVGVEFAQGFLWRAT